MIGEKIASHIRTDRAAERAVADLAIEGIAPNSETIGAAIKHLRSLSPELIEEAVKRANAFAQDQAVPIDLPVQSIGTGHR